MLDAYYTQILQAQKFFINQINASIIILIIIMKKLLNIIQSSRQSSSVTSSHLEESNDLSVFPYCSPNHPTPSSSQPPRSVPSPRETIAFTSATIEITATNIIEHFSDIKILKFYDNDGENVLTWL